MTPLGTRAPLGAPRVDPLADGGVTSCGVYQAERCLAGTQQRCTLYDPAVKSFVAAPDALLHRALLFDRWYDLYHQPDGQTAERAFNASQPAGTPESQWGAASRFDHFEGVGDSAIWTGVSLMSYALRYFAFGTEADYQRVEKKTRALLTQFDVTGVPGYLARHHFLLLDPAAPRSDQHLLRYDAAGLGGDDHLFEPASAPDLPAVYTDGLRGPDGQLWRGMAVWHGNPSIDQYTGPMVAFPLVHGLLRDPALKARITAHLTCYLKRLQRIEVRDLQQNPDALGAIQNYFAGGALTLEPGDIDLTRSDTLVLYALPQLNAKNADTYARACPPTVALAASRVLDATSPNFLLDVLELGVDLASGGSDVRATGYDHAYIPTVRGGDAVHLMHLAAMAFHFTGEEQYRSFFHDELVTKLRTVEVAHTAGALQVPRWCRAYYGDHITFPAFWGLVNLLGDSPVRTELVRAMEVELWQKSLGDVGNLKFDLLYAATVKPPLATGRDVALGRALSTLRAMGGNGAGLDEPRRGYAVDRTSLIAGLPASGNSTRCPTEDERRRCEDGFAFLGLRVPGESITHTCDGRPGECTLGSKCADAIASNPLPPGSRGYEDFLWQRDPFKLGARFSPEGMIQSPGLDFAEEYWLARFYGFVTEGAGQVLAWQPVGSCQ